MCRGRGSRCLLDRDEGWSCFRWKTSVGVCCFSFFLDYFSLKSTNPVLPVSVALISGTGSRCGIDGFSGCLINGNDVRLMVQRRAGTWCACVFVMRCLLGSRVTDSLVRGVVSGQSRGGHMSTRFHHGESSVRYLRNQKHASVV